MKENLQLSYNYLLHLWILVPVTITKIIRQDVKVYH